MIGAAQRWPSQAARFGAGPEYPARTDRDAARAERLLKLKRVAESTRLKLIAEAAEHDLGIHDPP